MQQCFGRCDLSTQRYDANLLRCFDPRRAKRGSKLQEQVHPVRQPAGDRLQERTSHALRHLLGIVGQPGELSGGPVRQFQPAVVVQHKDRGREGVENV